MPPETVQPAAPHPARPEEEASLADALQQYRTESGRTLQQLLDESPILLVFLRHFGCSFCREAIDQVAQIQPQLQARGVRPVFVHLGTPERAKPYFDYYHLSSVERIGNPDGSLYAHPVFHLERRHPFTYFLQPTVWKGWMRTVFGKYGVGMIREDAHQMPGVFFLRDGRIVRSFRYKTIADQPNYLKLAA
ncbi:MAG TPA: SelL-related redox protein [Acidobacteriaceae bacterium]|jgi:hypothetical protein|nr:SelL-related redox protein [Acidobacteriaceae bacterium]